MSNRRLAVSCDNSSPTKGNGQYGRSVCILWNMSKEVTINKDNFENEVKSSDVPVLLDFWADWCMPCKMVAPVLEELSSEYDGKLKIGKVDVDQNQELASQYNVVSIPTLLLMKDGEVVKQQVGAVPRAQIEELIKDYV